MTNTPKENWMKAGQTSSQAHLITKAGSNLLITACQVALNRDTATPATAATCRCFECQQTINQ